MKKQNRNRVLMTLVGGMVLGASLLGSKEARAETPQEIIMKMAMDAVKSFAGEKFKSLLFPSNGIDYDRIRRDMEEVTRQRIVAAEADRVLGRIAGASQNARIDLMDEDPVEKLGETRKELVLDINGITKGDFQIPGIGNYVLGAQVEMSILAGMLEHSPKPLSAREEILEEQMVAAGRCGRDCVLKALVDRVKAHTDHLNQTTSLIRQNAMKAAVDRVFTQCEMDYEVIDIMGRPHKKDIGYNFRDRARDFVSELTWDRNKCEQERLSYVGNRQQEAVVALMPDLRWMHFVRASWSKALVTAIPEKYQESTKEALLDVMPVYLAKYPACYNQIKQGIERSPGKTACQVFKDMSSNRQLCPLSGSADPYRDLFETVGCKAE